MNTPNLTESVFGDFMVNNLKTCHENRVKIYSVALNVGLLLVFILIVGTILYYRYQNQPSPYEKKQKLYKDQQMILERIRYYQAEQKNIMASPIGNLTSPMGKI